MKKAINIGRELSIPKEYNTLAEMLLFIEKKYPNKGLMFIDAQGNEDFMSYKELSLSARRQLYMLSNNGIKAGDVLILEIDNSKEFYISFWACMFGGIVAAPVTQPTSWDPNSTGVYKLLKIWEILDKPFVLIEESNRKHYKGIQDSERFSGFKFLSEKDLLSEKTGEVHKTDPEAIAFLQFSSGSTGIPKGVQLSNKNIINNIVSINNGFKTTDKDVAFSWLPHTHDMGLFCQHLSPIVKGCNEMLFSPFTFVRSPYMFLKKISEHKGTWFCSPNFGIDWMTTKIPESKLSTLDLSSLRFIINGAEPISTSVVNAFAEKFKVCGYKANVMTPSYGMAEATVGVTMSDIDSLPIVEKIYRSHMINSNLVIHIEDDSIEDKIEFVREGPPLDGVSIRIADEEGYTLPENMIGEIQIKGDNVTSGYYNCEEATKNMYIDGWLHTGDLGYMVDGDLVITGRIKDVLFIRGQNYFAHDLEEVIYGLGTLQRGNLTIVGLVNSKTQKEEIIVFVKYKSDVEKFIQLRKKIVEKLSETLGIEVTHVIPVKMIPKTTSGKLQRFNLQKKYENGEYDEVLKEISQYLDKKDENKLINLPETDLEIFLHDVWCKILNVKKENISIDDNFLLLGGNSIKAFQLLDEIERNLNRKVGFEVLALCTTIREIADYLQDMIESKKNELTSELTDAKKDKRNSIAITGIGLRLPDANNIEEYWNNLFQGKDLVKRVSEKRKKLSSDQLWNDWIAEIKDIDLFDNEFFEITSEEAEFMDPQQKLVLESAYEALEDAGMKPGQEDPKNIGVYSAVCTNTFYQLLAKYIEKNGHKGVHPKAMVGNMNNIISSIISHTFNFTGPSMSIDTACSSFLASIHTAVEAIRDRKINGAVVSGANILTTKIVHQLSLQAGIVSSTSHCKVFDESADGSVLGEGVVVVYLEPLEKAIKENKNIYGVIRGSAIKNDGYSFGIMTPNPRGQHNTLVEAYQDANITPDEISYIETHGTGTTIGDPVEVNSLLKIFEDYDKSKINKIGIGSVKTNIGHLFAAAGGASLIKVLLCLKNKKIAPSLHLENINPSLRIEKTPFHVVTEVEEWNTLDNNTRKAGVSAFGLGGTNAHVIVEEWNDSKKVQQIKTNQLLTLSAKSEVALEKIIQNSLNLIDYSIEDQIQNLCYTHNKYRTDYPYRASFNIDIQNKKYSLISKNKYNKLRNAKICVVIGDIKNEFNINSINENDNSNSIFVNDYTEIFDCANEHDLEFEKVDILNFAYCYSMINNLKKNGMNIVEIRGFKTGKIVADLLENKIELLKAIQLFCSKDYKTSDIENSKIRADLILTFGMLENDFNTNLNSKNEYKYNIHNISINSNLFFEENLLLITGELYTKGVNFDWDNLYPNGSAKIIHLPSYPFEKKENWIKI